MAPVKQSVHGWLNLDKAEGVTSTTALGEVRKLFNAKKAGHAGTLDPLASGILPIAFGEATKTVSYMMDQHKSYDFTVRWGEATATDDREGDVVETSAVRPSRAEIEAALGSFVGTIDQTPPAFSAIKVKGKRAYDLARSGEAPALKSRPVHVRQLRLVDTIDADHSRFEVFCGKGVYVRSLARDLAHKLGTVGHLSALRRTRVGPFSIESSITLEKLIEMSHKGDLKSCLKPVSTSLDDIPAIAVSGTQVQRLRMGQAISLTRLQVNQVSTCGTAYASLGMQVVATGEIKSGRFHPKRVFHLPMKGIDDVDYA